MKKLYFNPSINLKIIVKIRFHIYFRYPKKTKQKIPGLNDVKRKAALVPLIGMVDLCKIYTQNLLKEVKNVAIAEVKSVVKGNTAVAFRT